MRPLWRFLCPGSSKPIRGQWKPPIAVLDHFLIHWQLNWRLDGLLCKTMSCLLPEWLALISLDALETSTRADMLTTSLVILVLSSTYCSASQSSKGKGDRGRKRGRGEARPKPLISAAYGSPVESDSAWRHALTRTHKLPSSDILTPEPGTKSSASVEQTLYSANASNKMT